MKKNSHSPLLGRGRRTKLGMSGNYFTITTELRESGRGKGGGGEGEVFNSLLEVDDSRKIEKKTPT